MSKKKEKDIEIQIKANKKDTSGLFDGNFKSVEFESKKYKQEKYNNRKNIKRFDEDDIE